LVRDMITLPFQTAVSWFRSRQPPTEHAPLLNSQTEPGLGSYLTITRGTTETDAESTSSEGYPTVGYETHYAALPSVNEQMVTRYREHVLSLGSLAAFALSFVLLGIDLVLITTGRHKARVEVDVGVMIGVVSSLCCSSLALGMTLYRRDRLSVSHRLAVWSVFITNCCLNGMLLVLVVGTAK
jgi:hypothetical protein